MAVAVAKGDKGKCDKLFSKLIRRNGVCENCDYRCPPECDPQGGIHRLGCRLQCAHLITRHRIATRCVETNAFSLCAKCHHYFGLWPLEFSTFVLDRRSVQTYTDLRSLAESGVKIDWSKTLAGLTERWNELRNEYDF